MTRLAICGTCGAEVKKVELDFVNDVFAHRPCGCTPSAGVKIMDPYPR